MGFQLSIRKAQAVSSDGVSDPRWPTRGPQATVKHSRLSLQLEDRNNTGTFLKGPRG
jgi:hypothetical protein